MEKYNSPFPGRQITGNDFKELVDYLNSVINESNLTQEQLKAINDRIEKLNIDTDNRVKEFNNEFQKGQTVLKEIDAKNLSLSNKLEGFYGRQIELFGVFIAIFSFIIAGIQIAAKVEGNFLEKLATSASIFIPVTLCIVVLLVIVKKIIK
jgi:hypothetical protein